MKPGNRSRVPGDVEPKAPPFVSSSRLIALAAILAGISACAPVKPPVDGLHGISVVNHSDACVIVFMFHHATGVPTSPQVPQHAIAPGGRYSVSLHEDVNDVWVEATVLSDRGCRRHAPPEASLAGYAMHGKVVIVGKKPQYVFVSGALP